MKKTEKPDLSRRQFAAGATALGVAAPGMLRAQSDTPQDTVDIRVNNYVAQTWKGYFKNLRKGVILVDTTGRTLNFWSEDEKVHKIYPVSVPLSPELTRLGRTRIVRKKIGPDWRPTPQMLIRNPEYPPYIAPDRKSVV